MAGRVHLVRHTESVHSVDHDFARLDPGLNPLGRHQAEDIGRSFRSPALKKGGERSPKNLEVETDLPLTQPMVVGCLLKSGIRQFVWLVFPQLTADQRDNDRILQPATRLQPPLRSSGVSFRQCGVQRVRLCFRAPALLKIISGDLHSRQS
ncbi:hypothetical protein V1515DRAFT_118881 [Lipomyces mesembrius]